MNEHTLEAVPDPDKGIQDNDSLLTSLKARAKAVAEETTADFDIPGYEGSMFVRYRVLDSSEIDDIRRRVRQQIKNPTEQITAASLDTLIAACEEVWVRDGGKEIPLREVAEKELPIRYDDVLAEVLGFSTDNARATVVSVFGGNGLAAQAHSGMVSQWMMRINVGVDGQLGGI